MRYTKSKNMGRTGLSHLMHTLGNLESTCTLVKLGTQFETAIWGFGIHSICTSVSDTPTQSR